MKKKIYLIEDDNDILSKTPKTKFLEILEVIDKDVSSEILDDIITNYACMEHIIKEKIYEDKINEYLKNYYATNKDDIDDIKKSLYMEFVGNIIFKLPQ